MEVNGIKYGMCHLPSLKVGSCFKYTGRYFIKTDYTRETTGDIMCVNIVTGSVKEIPASKKVLYIPGAKVEL